MNHELPARPPHEYTDGGTQPPVTVTILNEIINQRTGVNGDEESLSTSNIKLGLCCAGFNHDVWVHNLTDAEREALLSTVGSYTLTLVVRHGRLYLTHLQPEGGELVELNDLSHY